jgi:RNA polymerase sigma-70 factor (ECF subfamily)
MMHSLDDRVVYDEQPAHRVEFSSREQDLLAAWERANVPQEIDDECEQRLLAAYDDMRDVPLDDLEAYDRTIVRRMAAECEAETQDSAREFREIAKEHEVYLHRIAYRLSGDKETTKDLVQETLVRALHHFGQFQQGTNARGWLVTILTRLYYDMLKHARVISRAEGDLVTLATVECDMEAPVIPDSQLWAAVKALEPDLRGVVERCYVHEMSYKAIADELKVPVGTIGTRLRRARERLRALLSPSDVTSA